MTEKLKITKKEFEDLYEIQEITGETEDNSEKQHATADMPDKQDTTPTLYNENKAQLTEEEQQYDKELEELVNFPKEEEQ